MNATVNTAAFTAMVEQLAGLSAAKLRDVLNAEVTSVLNKTIKNTKIAKAGRIKARQRNQEVTMQPASIYKPKHPERRKLFSTKAGRGNLLKYDLQNFRYPAQLWQEIKARRATSLAKKLKAVGLARKSWWLIGKALNLAVEGGRFTGAVAVTGKEYPENITVARSQSEEKIGIKFSNSQPTVQLPQVGGAGALKRAIAGRISYFNRNANKAVFAETARIAAAYKGITVRARN